jgi:hypothetical protein
MFGNIGLIRDSRDLKRQMYLEEQMKKITHQQQQQQQQSSVSTPQVQQPTLSSSSIIIPVPHRIIGNSGCIPTFNFFTNTHDTKYKPTAAESH